MRSCLADEADQLPLQLLRFEAAQSPLSSLFVLNMTSLPADSLMDSSYIAQDLITSLARPKNQRQPFKKAPGPSGLRNNLTSSSSATALDMTEVDETLAMDEPSTVRPATRTVNIQHINKQSKLPSKLLPDSLTQGAQTSTNENTRALELEVKSLQEALSAQETQLASKDAEIAQLKDKLAKQAKKTSPPAKTTVPALGDTEFKVLEQQFAQQERLLSGYQKENERATAELQHLRSRLVPLLLSQGWCVPFADRCTRSSQKQNDGDPFGASVWVRRLGVWCVELYSCIQLRYFKSKALIPRYCSGLLRK